MIPTPRQYALPIVRYPLSPCIGYVVPYVVATVYRTPGVRRHDVGICSTESSRRLHVVMTPYVLTVVS